LGVHHAVRAATVLYTRIVEDALEAGLIHADSIVGQTDEALLVQLAERAADSGTTLAARIDDLRARRLPKRAAEVPAAELDGAGEWLTGGSPLKRDVEKRLAAELDLGEDDVYLDYPAKPAMFSLDILVARRDSDVLRLGPGGHAGLIGLPNIAEALYRTARVLRLFTHHARRRVDPLALAAIARLDVEAATARLRAGGPFLTSRGEEAT
jgi:hypothetical protein